MKKFYKNILCATIIAIPGLLSGCGTPRPLTIAEQDAYMAKQQCIQAANQMNPEWQNSENPFWNQDFIACMHQFGVPDSAILRMWY